jgi:hypothetical protein
LHSLFPIQPTQQDKHLGRETHPLPPVMKLNELKSGGSFMNAPTIMRSAYKYKKCYQVKAAKCSRRAISPRLLLRIRASRLLSFPGPSPHARQPFNQLTLHQRSSIPSIFFICMCVHLYIYILYILGQHRHEKNKVSD